MEEKLDGVEMITTHYLTKTNPIYTQLLINNLITHKVEIDKKNLTKYLYAHVNRGVNIIYTNKLKDISPYLILQIHKKIDENIFKKKKLSGSC